MIIRALNTDGSPQFGQGTENFLFDNNAIAENIATRLRCFLRDCYFDQTMGLDWRRFFSIPTSSQEIELSVRSLILQSYGVVKLNSISLSIDDVRKIILSYNVDTIFTSNFTYTLQNITSP